ncbi:recombinase family protein [Streptomyces sp. NPDC019890]|uniref:recombinase family protein n=1 Tax=Streptomyces sp. NPDC019890 TaxID=3365064 RepID=UPI00384F52EB
MVLTATAARRHKVTGLDRLSRSVLRLVTLGAELRERGIGRHVIEQGIDTATMEGRAMGGTAAPRPCLRTAVRERGELRRKITKGPVQRTGPFVYLR